MTSFNLHSNPVEYIEAPFPEEEIELENNLVLGHRASKRDISGPFILLSSNFL
jgi:hypothetical protein